MAQWALRWVLMADAVTCAIPGARTVTQATDNAAADGLPPLDAPTMTRIRAVYDELIREPRAREW